MEPFETPHSPRGWSNTSWVFVALGMLILALNAMRIGPSKSKLTVSYGALPAAVIAAIDSAYPGAVFLEASREGAKPRAFYDVQMALADRRVGTRFDGSGTVIEEECEIPAQELPATVRVAFANSAQGSWPILSAERVRQHSPKPGVCYELIVGRRTMKFELVYGEDGRRMSARKLDDFE